MNVKIIFGTSARVMQQFMHLMVLQRQSTHDNYSHCIWVTCTYMYRTDCKRPIYADEFGWKKQQYCCYLFSLIVIAWIESNAIP